MERIFAFEHISSLHLFIILGSATHESTQATHRVDLRSLGSTPHTTANFAYTPGGTVGGNNVCSSTCAGGGGAIGGGSSPSNVALLQKPRTPDGVSDDTDVSCQYTPSCCLRPSIIDGYSRVLFPLAFVLFNTIYWVTYLNLSEDLIKGDDFVFLKRQLNSVNIGSLNLWKKGLNM